VHLGSVPADAARLVWIRWRCQGLACPSSQIGPPVAPVDERELAVLQDAAVEIGYGPRENRYRSRIALCLSGRRCSATQSRILKSSFRIAGYHRRSVRHHRSEGAPREQSHAEAVSSAKSSLSRSAQPHAGRAAAAL